jgi:hypothetical protein
MTFMQAIAKAGADVAPQGKPSVPSQPRLPADDSGRLQRLEHGMEAIAIEVERISEGQRFVTKLLSESKAESVPR